MNVCRLQKKILVLLYYIMSVQHRLRLFLVSEELLSVNEKLYVGAYFSPLSVFLALNL